MNEWAAAAPVVVETKAKPSQPPAAARRRRLRPRWAFGLIIALTMWMIGSGALLLIFKQEYTLLEMLPAIVVLAAGEIVVIALIYPIAWRTGRLK